METYKPILINMPLYLLESLDNAAAQMNLCRSEMLRRCLRRDLTFIANRELPHLNEAKQSTIRDYAHWSSQTVQTATGNEQSAERRNFKGKY